MRVYRLSLWVANIVGHANGGPRLDYEVSLDGGSTWSTSVPLVSRFSTGPVTSSVSGGGCEGWVMTYGDWNATGSGTATVRVRNSNALALGNAWGMDDVNWHWLEGLYTQYTPPTGNLLTNGNFEAGENVGYTTGSYGGGGFPTQGSAVWANAALNRAVVEWQNPCYPLFDHTTGSPTGRYMVYRGAAVASAAFWGAGPFTVLAGKPYRLQWQIASLSEGPQNNCAGGAQAIFIARTSVDGGTTWVDLTAVSNRPTGTCQSEWSVVHVDFHAPVAASGLLVQLRNDVVTSCSNSWALDDMWFGRIDEERNLLPNGDFEQGHGAWSNRYGISYWLDPAASLGQSMLTKVTTPWWTAGAGFCTSVPARQPPSSFVSIRSRTGADTWFDHLRLPVVGRRPYRLSWSSTLLNSNNPPAFQINAAKATTYAGVGSVTEWTITEQTVPSCGAWSVHYINIQNTLIQDGWLAFTFTNTAGNAMFALEDMSMAPIPDNLWLLNGDFEGGLGGFRVLCMAGRRGMAQGRQGRWRAQCIPRSSRCASHWQSINAEKWRRPSQMRV